MKKKCGRLKKWKNLWAKRSRMGRGLRTAVNLLLIAAVLVYAWGLCGYPLFFPQWEFHRLERENLIPRGKIVFSANSLPWENRVTEVEIGGERADFPDITVAGASANWAAVMVQKRFYVYPRGEGPDPVPVPGSGYMSTQRGSGEFINFNPILFLDVPRGAARAEVEMDIRSYGGKLYHLAGSGSRLESGAWLFGLEAPEDTGWPDRWYEGASYVLRTYGPDGAPLETFQGIVPAAS